MGKSTEHTTDCAFGHDMEQGPGNPQPPHGAVDAKQRERGIVRAGVVGIVGNLVLTAFKLAVGFLANSIAIILDAVNNASDALSSIITIVGTKLAGRLPDREHPFGHGRIEYLASLAIALIILAAGVMSAKESVEKIVWPVENDYSWVTLVVVVAAIVAKIAIGRYFRIAGQRFDSKALSASAVDSNYDALLSVGTLVAAVVSMVWGANIDGVVGLVISVFVLKAGVGILRESLDPIIGVRESAEFGQQIRSYVASFPQVEGAYDLILQNYGPNTLIGSIHIEVPETMTAGVLNDLSRHIIEGVYERFNVVLTVGVYAANTSQADLEIRSYLQSVVAECPEILQAHGFYVSHMRNTIDFDLVVDFGADPDAVKAKVVERMRQRYPGFRYDVVIDVDYD